MTTGYEHIQKGGKWIYYLAIPVGFEFIFIVALVWILNAHDEQPIPESNLFLLLGGVALIPMTVLTWAFLMMSSLTISIDEAFIHVCFGHGLWKKEFPTMLIESCKPVKPNWICGYGIRWIGRRHWLYNIAGPDAVEITFKNGKKVSLGTDEPEKLAAAIESAIKTN